MDVGSTNDLKPESLICVRRKGIFEAAADEAGASSIGEKTRKKLADYSGDTLRGDTAAARFFVIVRASARGKPGVLERQRRTTLRDPCDASSRRCVVTSSYVLRY